MLLSLGQLVFWGFWGLLILLLSRGFLGGVEVSSTGRQLVLSLLVLLLAVLNPLTAFAFLARRGILTWAAVVAIQAAALVAYAFFFGGSPRTWQEVVVLILAGAALAIAFPRSVREHV